MQNTVAATVEALRMNMNGVNKIEGSYQLLGYDFVVDEDMSPFLIEINGFPNLNRQDQSGRSLSVQLMKDMIGVVIDPIIFGKVRNNGGFIAVV